MASYTDQPAMRILHGGAIAKGIDLSTTSNWQGLAVTAIIRPLIVVRRKTDDVVGTLTMQERPWFYFGFKPDDNGQP